MGRDDLHLSGVTVNADQKEPATQIFEAKSFVVEGAAVTKALK